MTEKREPKTRDQILAEMKSSADFQKKMAFVKNTFWPQLCEASESIDDAVMQLSGFNTAIMQEFLALMKEKKVSDLNLGVKLDPKSDKFLENQKLLDLFSDMSVFDAKDYIEGMRSEIQLFLTEEQKKRPLAELKTKWADEL